MKTELIQDFDDPDLYINRELSMLDFQRRVLEEALEPGCPPLERLKFISILDSNLDEFFMIRVGGLKMQIEAGVVDFSIDGRTPAQQLAAIRPVAHQLMKQARETLYSEILPLLHEAGIHILDYEALSDKQRNNIDSYFEEVVFPVLTPLAFDPGHPFPHISNLSLNLAVVIRDQDQVEHFARVKVPASLPRFVPLKRSSGGTKKDGTVPYNHYFVPLEQVIAAKLAMLFPGMEIVESHPFRVIRNADMEIQELEASDLLETMEEGVRQRRFGSVVHLAHNEAMPKHIREILISNMLMDANDVYVLDGLLGLRSLMNLYSIDRYDLKDPPFTPAVPDLLRFDTKDGNIFAAIRSGDVLLHHPYESFSPVIDFLQAAATDPSVLAIKQTLYRVGKNSPVVKTLLEARRDHGKQVATLVELKARFDEESNIGWARMLETEGVHVIYGLVGLKTHTKLLLVVRQEGDQIRRYVHLGTGNYNHITARLYEDLGMFSCDPDLGADATDLFNYLTGYSAKSDFRKLLVAPINLGEGMVRRIEREIKNVKEGGQGRLIFKMNALVDQSIIEALYRASQAGVNIELIVRGICCLRPGVPGLSENIRVRSILGRFLEHSRIYYFYNNGQEEIYLGSADLMPRNINRRVEALFPVEDPRLIARLRDDVLDLYLRDNSKARLMGPDGEFTRLQPDEGEEPLSSQDVLLRRVTANGQLH